MGMLANFIVNVFSLYQCRPELYLYIIKTFGLTRTVVYFYIFISHSILKVSYQYVTLEVRKKSKDILLRAHSISIFSEITCTTREDNLLHIIPQVS